MKWDYSGTEEIAGVKIAVVELSYFALEMHLNGKYEGVLICC